MENLDYADDIVLLAQRYQDIEEKYNTLATKAASLDLKISAIKSGHLRMNSRTNESIMFSGEVLARLITLPTWDLKCPLAEMEKKRSKSGFQR